MSDPDEPLAVRSAALLDAVRARRPLVQCVTNLVSMDLMANVLLAVGASPAMMQAPEESGDFLTRADALVCNIGTLSAQRLLDLDAAATAAHMHGCPWVLDPVGAGATAFRDEAVRRLLRHRPAVVRGNASEILATARIAGLLRASAAPHGVDASHAADEAATAARRLARDSFCVVAATGAVDLATDGERALRLANGSALMAQVTAMGCALSGVVAAFLAVADDPFAATTAALAVYGVAGEIAAASASGPGSFRVAFVDTLANLTAQDIATTLKVAT